MKSSRNTTAKTEIHELILSSKSAYKLDFELAGTYPNIPESS